MLAAFEGPIPAPTSPTTLLTYVVVDFERGCARAGANFAAQTGIDLPDGQEVPLASLVTAARGGIPARELDAVRAAIDAMRGGQQAGAVAFTFVPPEGEARAIEAVWAAEYTPAGAVRRLSLTLLDTAARSERAARDSEMRYRLALTAGRMGSWETNLVARTRKWSDEAMRLFGLDLPGGIGKVGGDDDEYVRALHPDDRHLAHRFWELARRQDAYTAEYRIVRPDGTTLWLSGRGLVVERAPDGTPLRLVSIMADVTERRQAEQELRIERERLAQALTTGQMGVYDFDMRHDVLWWSPQVYTIFGRHPETFTPTSQTVAASIHPDDLPLYLHKRAEGFVHHKPYELEFRAIRPDGSIAWIHHFGQAEYDAAGEPVRSFGIAMDITARKRVEEALRDADRKKDQFIATLAHELRNPLAPIRNAVALLRNRRDADPQLTWCRDVIERQVGQMAHLLEDLLDVSRLTRGQFHLRSEPLDLGRVIEHAVEIARPSVDAARHRLSVTLPPQRVTVDGDLTRLAQVFSNLLINAAKYTPPGGRIALTVDPQEDEVVVRVTDNGMGIAPDQLLRIFDMFGQGGGVTERFQEGLGIGLALARGLVQMHGGRIGASSAGLGKGSEFTVWLPAHERTPSSVSLPADAEPGTEPAPGLRILVADDLRDNADSLAMLLRASGHVVAVAYDGEEAFETAATFRPDVALLDLGMPKVDGFETCRRIRAQPWGRRITLIAQTGWGQDKDRQETLAAGFDHHIVKPIDPQQLLALLRADRMG